MKTLLVVFFGLSVAFACDIIVHIKSDTSKRFEAQVASPNGRKSEKWNFSTKGEHQTFQQKARECGLGDWQITTFEDGKSAKNVKVSLNGIGQVYYVVGDDLNPIQKSRYGAICKGQCAPLA